MPRTRSPRSSLPSPLDGRRFWIAGIGGAGMSAYALLARAWGAEVRGWDRVRTPYLEQLEGIDVEISDDRHGPPTAGRRSSRRRSRDESREGARGAARRARVAARLHRGRGRTWQDDDEQHDRLLSRAARPGPRLVDRRGRPTARRERRDRGGMARRGGRRIGPDDAELRPRVAVVTNVDLDHHATFGSRAEVAGSSTAGSRTSRRWCAERSSPLTRGHWRSPVSTTAATRRPRSRHSSSLV